MVGSDANDGLSKATPWLTANKALTTVIGSTFDGDELKFNDGRYIYTDTGGRCIFSHVGFSINFENSWLTTLVFDGAENQGLRFNGSNSQARTFSIGNAVLEASDNKREVFYCKNDSLTSELMTLNWGARFNVLPTALDGQIGFYLAASYIVLTIDNGGHTGVAGKYRPFLMDNAIGVIQIDIDIKRWLFDLTCEIEVTKTGAFEIAHGAANAAGRVSVRGVTGSITDTGISSVIYGVHIRNGPNESSITNCNDFHIESANRNVCPFVIDAPTLDGIGCDDAVIGHNVRVTADSLDGFLAVMGGEFEQHDLPRGVIENNEIRAVNTYGQAMHGICHIDCLDGIRRFNKVSGASLGSLTKLGTAISYGNTYTNVGGYFNKFLYAKGADAGAEFFDEICVIDRLDYDGVIEQSTRDIDTDKPSGLVSFRGNRIMKSGSGSIASAAILNQTGTSTDPSESTTYGLTIDPGLTLPAVVAKYQGANYATIADANASATITAMAQNEAAELTVVSSGILGPVIRPLLNFGG